MVSPAVDFKLHIVLHTTKAASADVSQRIWLTSRVVKSIVIFIDIFKFNYFLVKYSIKLILILRLTKINTF